MARKPRLPLALNPDRVDRTVAELRALVFDIGQQCDKLDELRGVAKPPEGHPRARSMAPMSAQERDHHARETFALLAATHDILLNTPLAKALRERGRNFHRGSAYRRVVELLHSVIDTFDDFRRDQPHADVSTIADLAIERHALRERPIGPDDGGALVRYIDRGPDGKAGRILGVRRFEAKDLERVRSMLLEREDATGVRRRQRISDLAMEILEIDKHERAAALRLWKPQLPKISR